MHNLIKASLFKLFRDRTFIVTAIIGVIIAFFMIGASALSKFLSEINPKGQSFLYGCPLFMEIVVSLPHEIDQNTCYINKSYREI